MRTDQMRPSENVQDRRGMGPRLAMGGGGTLIIMLIVWALGGNPLSVLQQGATVGTGSAPTSAAQDQQAQFVKLVLGDTEDVWTELFRKRGQTYSPAPLVLFSGTTDSACGTAQAATGPFYCPADSRVYIDLSFYDELSRRFGAPGDFAQAYVIAHEVGHHVQHLLGITNKVDAMRSRVSKEQFNQLSVRLELQADYFAGVWAHHARAARAVLESGDLEEGLAAAAAIGDDRLQRQSQGRVVPESFTHGTSAQRVRWFKMGFDSGDMDGGDTFSADSL